MTPFAGKHLMGMQWEIAEVSSPSFPRLHSAHQADLTERAMRNACYNSLSLLAREARFETQNTTYRARKSSLPHCALAYYRPESPYVRLSFKLDRGYLRQRSSRSIKRQKHWAKKVIEV